MSEKKQNKLKNTIALKRNIYAVVLSVIFIAVVIGLTVLSTVFAQKYPLNIDLTTNKLHSIAGDNFDYIKGVEEKIDIYVTLTEKEYGCSTATTADISYIAAKNHFVDYNSSNMQYYVQTVELLKKYNSYNSNITVTFVDTYDAKSRAITDRFADYSWSIGDILVESNFKLNGKDVTRRTVVGFLETYTLEDINGMAEELKGNAYYQMMGYSATAGQGYGYFITENKVETMISSAIYQVTSPNTPLFLVPTSISSKDAISAYLENTLSVNNFAVEYNEEILSTLLDSKNYDKYAGIILANCKSDITVGDRELIENFLDNGGKKGKSLFYFAGTNTTKLTNLCGLLGDWGVGFEPGILYETDASFHVTDDNTFLAFESTLTDFTTRADSLGAYYGGRNAVYMKQLWQNYNVTGHTRETEALLNTGSFGKTTIMPLDANIKDWKPAKDAQTDKFVTGIMAMDTDTVDNKFVTSYIVAYASHEMISDEAFSTDSWGNLNLVLDTFNEATGNTDAPFSFVPKKIETQSYYASVTESETSAIKWIFMGAVPVIVFGTGLCVWFRRKRK